MIINHNVSAINSHRVLKFNNEALNKDVEKLSSGMRINRAGDDASGLAVSEKMRTQVNGLRRAEMNAEDGISLIQTTEGWLQETQEIVQRIRVLAVQAANGIYTEEDRQQIQVEVSQLVDEIDRIASQAEFNKMKLMTGAFSRLNPSASMWFHIGANMHQRERVYIETMTTAALGLRNPTVLTFISLSTLSKANSVIGLADDALKMISKQRADLGAYQNRLEHAAKGLMNGYENIQAAESRIRDTDMAEQMTSLTRYQILTQAGTAMLAQANQKSQNVLQLLR
ncbi:MAG: flagellin [Leptospiraceae bacterium]|jgi:flagellin|nr:flagellin [Leptospiraceae bacterium]MBK7055515.1 flagellin [Leptospiraceae bacterium]MBK9502347.1 flagellin [Leptospiraceae bacterium]MBL0263071.1 flagellin [Leptospiraceae bacterium]HRG74793.1 flagellin [Leptospiraceae bacterium]